MDKPASGAGEHFVALPPTRLSKFAATRSANSCQEGWRVGISRSFSRPDAIEFILFSCQDSRPYLTDSNASAEEALSQVEIAWTEYEANSSGG